MDPRGGNRTERTELCDPSKRIPVQEYELKYPRGGI